MRDNWEEGGEGQTRRWNRIPKRCPRAEFHSPTWQPERFTGACSASFEDGRTCAVSVRIQVDPNAKIHDAAGETVTPPVKAILRMQDCGVEESHESSGNPRGDRSYKEPEWIRCAHGLT